MPPGFGKATTKVAPAAGATAGFGKATAPAVGSSSGKVASKPAGKVTDIRRGSASARWATRSQWGRWKSSSEV